MNWYVVYTKAWQEQRALQNLLRQGLGCYLPMLQLEKVIGGILTVCVEPLFPRYLFVQLDPTSAGKNWNCIRSTRGVARLVTFGTEPAIVDASLLDMLRIRAESSAIQPLFKQGEKVRVTSGPFAGMEGLYQMADGESRALVLIGLLQQPAKLRVMLRQLEAVSN